MQDSSAERALVVLGDYLFELETAQAPRGRGSYGVKRSVATAAAPEKTKDPTPFDIAAEAAALEWENSMLRKWRIDGRITADGLLRVRDDALNPYTIKDIARIMPQLNVFDRLAALINLDGVVVEGYMAKKEHENIKGVVEQIVDERIVRQLQDGDTAMRIRDLVRLEVSEIFAEMKAIMATPQSTLKVGGRKQKCSKCHAPGHRAPTCGRKAGDMTPPDGSYDPDALAAAAAAE